MEKWQEKSENFKAFMVDLGRRFHHERCFSVAAALSFTSLLALVPLVTVIILALSLFPVSDKLVTGIDHFLFENFIPAAGETVQGYLREFSDKAGNLTAVGLGFLFVSSLMLLSTIEDAFNKIWKVPKGRQWLQRLVTYWAVLTLGPLLIVVSLSMTSTLLSSQALSEQTLIAGATRVAWKYLPILCELMAFILCYQAIPNVEVRLGDSFMGALAATILFEISKFGFGFYILNFDSYQRIYGALAAVPIFFLWIYLCWLVLFVGALIAATLHERRRQPVLPGAN